MTFRLILWRLLELVIVYSMQLAWLWKVR